MAKMTVEFDTEAKTFTAAIDGKTVDNVRAAEIYPSWDKDGEYRCTFVTKATDADTGITEVRQLFASETKAAQQALARKDGKAYPSADFPGFVEDRDTRAESKFHKDVADAFGCK